MDKLREDGAKIVAWTYEFDVQLVFSFFWDAFSFPIYFKFFFLLSWLKSSSLSFFLFPGIYIAKLNIQMDHFSPSTSDTI